MTYTQEDVLTVAQIGWAALEEMSGCCGCSRGTASFEDGIAPYGLELIDNPEEKYSHIVRIKSTE